MATVGSFNDDPLPTSEQVAEVRGFQRPNLFQSAVAANSYPPPTLPTPILTPLSPLTTRTPQVTKFLAELEGLTTKLEGKKLEARKVIQSKMSDLHQLIDKWETRFLDTMAETLDEKIETINKQVR